MTTNDFETQLNQAYSAAKAAEIALEIERRGVKDIYYQFVSTSGGRVPGKYAPVGHFQPIADVRRSHSPISGVERCS